MKKAFVTYLGSENFLPGIVVLNYSLKIHNPNSELVVLTDKNISTGIVSFLIQNSFTIKMIDEIENPYFFETDERGFKCLYTKLRIFELDEYEKIVYLDADMLVCENIEFLFDKPHMSAVVAGALIPGNKDWKKLNTGLLVVNPDKKLFDKLVSLITTLHSEAKDDQDFLNAYYDQWWSMHELHLDHKFNIPATYIDQYCEQQDFEFSFIDEVLQTKNIAVIHYWGPMKPWNHDEEEISDQLETKYHQSINLWWSYFYKATENYK